MKKIDKVLQEKNHNVVIEDELEQLVNTCTVEWLYNYYSRELLWSDKARQAWQDPNIKALDF